MGKWDDKDEWEHYIDRLPDERRGKAMVFGRILVLAGIFFLIYLAV